MGAAVAISIVNDRTAASIGDGATLTCADDLTLAADGSHAMATEAKTGASGGGVSIVPSVAVAISNVSSTATIGSGGATSISGTLTATATLNASALTRA